MNRLFVLAVGLSVLSVVFSQDAGAAYFQGLGDLPGGANESSAKGISADGSTVVGKSSSYYSEAFRWQRGAVMVGLGDLAGNTSPTSEAWDASLDGGVIVGSAKAPSFSEEPFRWTAVEGMQPLGNLGGLSPYGQALGVSADGSVIVGRANSPSGIQAFRWTESEGMIGLGDLPGGEFASSATSVSADGSVIVGVGTSLISGRKSPQAFRWTAAEGLVALGDLPGSDFYSTAWAVSADGQVVVGFGTSSASGYYHEAFRWTASTGMVALGDLPGGVSYDQVDSTAFDVSGDGSIVVGSGFSTAGTRAFIWDTTNGMRELSDVLTTEYGIDLSGWRLYEARAISDNGKVIAGYGRNLTAFRDEAWVVDLTGEPGADFDGDGKMDGADLVIWQTCYGTGDGADADNDGDTDGQDFLIWQRQFGSGLAIAETFSVPEPNAPALMIGAIIFLSLPRKNCRTPRCDERRRGMPKVSAHGVLTCH